MTMAVHDALAWQCSCDTYKKSCHGYTVPASYAGPGCTAVAGEGGGRVMASCRVVAAARSSRALDGRAILSVRAEAAGFPS